MLLKSQMQDGRWKQRPEESYEMTTQEKQSDGFKQSHQEPSSNNEALPQPNADESTGETLGEASPAVAPDHPSTDENQVQTKQAPLTESASTNPSQAARIRERLTSAAERQTDDRPADSTERAGRVEVPRKGPIEIPDADALDPSLEAQILSALDSDKSGPVATAPVAALDSDDSESPVAAEEIGPGSQLTGIVQQVHGEDVFIDAGLRGSIVIALRQFPENKPPSVGDSLTVIVETTDADGLIRARLPQGRSSAGGNWDALAVGQIVDCMVTGTNKGGLQVSVGNLRGFMPASQVDAGYIDNLESFVGQKLTAQITEVNKKKRNLVLSRRVLLLEEQAGQRDRFWATVETGQEFDGIVRTIKDYGAFVNIGALDGFLHIAEMSWSRINHPNEVLKVGQAIQVKILRKDDDKKRISLSMKQLIQNPWHSAAERYAAERVVTGTVSRLTEFGAFVLLEPGIEGLVHISQLAWQHVGRVNEVLSVGDTREFQVVEVDTKRKRVSLSLKALEERPEQPKREIPEEPVPRRKPNQDLRGGMSRKDGTSGLFGNPSDFT